MQIPATQINAFAVASYVYLRDEKAQNTEGGTFTSGAWRTRTLNTEVSDTDGICNLAANQISLAAGTYIFRIRCPGCQVDRHQARLQNVTDATTVMVGGSHFNESARATNGSVFVVGKAVIPDGKLLEVQHRCQTTFATSGFGFACNFTTEVYAEAEFWKVA